MMLVVMLEQACARNRGARSNILEAMSWTTKVLNILCATWFFLAKNNFKKTALSRSCCYQNFYTSRQVSHCCITTIRVLHTSDRFTWCRQQCCCFCITVTTSKHRVTSWNHPFEGRDHNYVHRSFKLTCGKATHLSVAPFGICDQSAQENIYGAYFKIYRPKINARIAL